MHQSAVWASLARYWTKEDALRLLCRAVVPSHKRLTLETHHSCHTTMMTAMMVIATSCHLCWTVVQVIMVVERGRVKFHNHQTELWKLWPFGLVAFWPCAMVCCGVLWCAVALWPCGLVALLPCGLLALWPFGLVPWCAVVCCGVLWPCGHVAMWPCYLVALRPFGLVPWCWVFQACRWSVRVCSAGRRRRTASRLLIIAQRHAGPQACWQARLYG